MSNNFPLNRRLMAALALGALVMFSGRLVPTVAAQQKHIDVQVEVHGVEGITAEDVEELAESLFASAGEAVTEEDGPDVLVVHLVIVADDDGNGLTIHVAAGALKTDVDFDSEAGLEGALHQVVEEVDDDE